MVVGVHINTMYVKRIARVFFERNRVRYPKNWLSIVISRGNGWKHERRDAFNGADFGSNTMENFCLEYDALKYQPEDNTPDDEFHDTVTKEVLPVSPQNQL